MKIQGIKKYFDKEGYIVQVLRNKNEIFEDIIKDNIKQIHTDVRLNQNKIRVDLICESENSSLVFVEVSIRNSCVKDFETHRNELIHILQFIGKYQFAQIILMCPTFLNEDIKSIEKLIASYNVKVYFVYIPTDLILKLQNHMNIDTNEKKKFIYNKSIIGKCIKVTSKNINAERLFVLKLNKEECGNPIAKAILKGLREEIYWHLAVFKYKDLEKNIIRIGTGTSDIMLNIYCDMYDKVMVEVDFAQRLDIFNIFKNYIVDMSVEIGNSIDIDPNRPKIFTEIPMFKNNKVTIDKAINTAKGYIEYITKMYININLSFHIS